jgi:protease-4
MRFFGKVWRLLVGVKDGLVLLFMLLFFAALFAALSASPKSGGTAEGALVLDLKGAIVEQPAEADSLSVLTGSSTGLKEYRLRDVVRAVDSAAKDDRVKAVVLDLDTFVGGGQASLNDVAASLARVRKAGKPVLAYATGYSDDAYLLAAQASEVWLNPMGAVLIAGPGGTNLYFKGLLDRLGVTANVYRVGAFKAAVEPFTRTDMSPEARAANQALAGALWENWQTDVRAARPKAQIAQYVGRPAESFAAAGGDMAKAAVQAGLVDQLGDRTAFGKRVAKIVGTADEKLPGDFKTIKYDSWIGANPAPNTGEIGVLTVAGEIVDGKAGPGTAGAETIVEALQKGLAQRNLKALVLRVDSPGGSTLASERIRQAVLEAKGRGLPVVVSMGSVAASGGYWISMPADRIFAEPETITGSIGVFGILPSFEGTLQKIGVGADGVKTTPLSGEPDLLRGPSPVADQLIQSSVENTYAKFLNIVSAARKMPTERVHQVAQGRVWDGGTARQLGLVDQFGSLGDAIREAARRAKLDPETAEAVYLEKKPSMWESCCAALPTRRDRARKPRRVLAGRFPPGNDVDARPQRCPPHPLRPGDPGALP